MDDQLNDDASIDSNTHGINITPRVDFYLLIIIIEKKNFFFVF